MRKRRLPVSRARVLVGLLCAVRALGAQTVDNAPDAQLDREMKRFTDVYALVDAHEADAVSADQAIYQGAIPGLLRKLDPHSVFFDPGQFDQLNQMERSTSKGFGTIVSLMPGRVIVLQALPGTPSSRSGMAPGDEILAVNNIRLDRLDLEQLTQFLGQARQKPAQLYIRRTGVSGLLNMTMTPEEMASKSVDRAFLLKPGIAYARVVSWESQTGQQLHYALEELGGDKLKGLVLDLRNNPGGIVGAAMEACAMFLEPGQVILSVRGRKTKPQVEKVPLGTKPYHFPVVVLVNEKSASASEIVAGALQDHDRALIVGETSFGKGLVESVFPLSEKTGMALTTALYYTPSGRSIQKPFHGGDFELASTAAHPNQQSDFKTDKGRTVQGGGGITPDISAEPEQPTRVTVALEASGTFVSFATEYVHNHKVAANFDVTTELLDQFQAYAAERRIQPGVGEWSSNREFIQNHLKAEILNQALGVEKGDEVELRYDPVVRKALEAVVG